MSPDHIHAGPLLATWRAFLDEVDGRLPGQVELHCLGGFVLATVYGLPRPTADVDFIAAVPSNLSRTLVEIAGRDSRLALKYKLSIDYVTIADYPEDYAVRLVEIPRRFSNLRLMALEVHDLVLAKLTRNSPVDRGDVEFLANARLLDPNVMRERYQKELRPQLANEARHDLTLRLWLEAYF
jgi:hypothetical protein